MTNSIRYRVTFQLLRTKTGPGEASYDVCTLHGPDKAIVLATMKHLKSRKGHVLSVSVETLPDVRGRNCAPKDLVDRMEW